MFFAAAPWEAANTNRSLGFAVPAGQAGMVGYGDFDRTLAALTGAATRAPYICGDQFTAADVYVGAQISWGVRFGSIPSTPEIDAYLGRILGRPAFQRAGTMDDAAAAEFGPAGGSAAEG